MKQLTVFLVLSILSIKIFSQSLPHKIDSNRKIINDTTKSLSKVNLDSLYTISVINDFYLYLYNNDKMPAKSFDYFKKALQEYIDEKKKICKNK